MVRALDDALVPGECCELVDSSSGHLQRYFFFQAEDGIRDIGVTGVQTCALPISPARGGLPGAGTTGVGRGRAAPGRRFVPVARRGGPGGGLPPRRSIPGPAAPGERARSEERRVGKECRCGGWRYRQKQKISYASA